jgi:hypothetical protein
MSSIEDPMIAWNLRNFDRIVFLSIFINLVFLVGFLSRKSPTFLSLTVTTTAIVVVLLMITRNEYGFAF